MKRTIALGLAMLAGGAIGATAVNGLHAQGTAPAAYAVVDISAITNPDVFRNSWTESRTGDGGFRRQIHHSHR